MEYRSSAPIEEASCICLGSGRFLRAVLVPAAVQAGLRIIIFQPRGTSFVQMMATRRQSTGTYEVDTVEFDGRVLTQDYEVIAAGSLSTPEGRAAWLALPKQLPKLRIIGIGVTEAGVAPGSQPMKDLAELLICCDRAGTVGPLSVINTDNVPGNGAMIHACVTEPLLLASLLPDADDQHGFLSYLSERVTFHNIMVDRITSHRDGDDTVPRCEPLPKKALVIEDLEQVLPPGLSSSPGVMVRTEAGQIAKDHQLKLRIANAIHTSMVYLMVLSRMPDTSGCIGHPYILRYIEVLMTRDISLIADELDIPMPEVEKVYDDWVKRLQHPCFGLSCLFVCQNASQKLGIRLMPTIARSICTNGLPSPALAFAVAVLLRFLTPMDAQPRAHQGVFCGRMDPRPPAQGCPPNDITYASDLHANFTAGTYEFRDGDGSVPRLLLAARMADNASGLAASGTDSTARHQAVETILSQQTGYIPATYGPFVALVSSLYGRLMQGANAMDMLISILEGDVAQHGAELDKRPLTPGEIPAVVVEEVNKVEVIDLHTHLLPPSHGDLMLWGIDELLTYHYLIAECFQTAPRSITPAHFFSLSKREQADLIWDSLFIQRSPISEACKGVLTTLDVLGLRREMRSRDLSAIRAWFDAQDPNEYCEKVFQVSGVKYCVMTNIPFEPEEAKHWRPHKKPYSKRFRSALRVDPLLKGDWETVSRCLKEAGYEQTLQGAKQYLRDWAQTMQPEYLMASTPHDFSYNPCTHGPDDGGCSATGAALLEGVLMPIAEELKLPIAMKFGAHRGVNPELRSGGDGVVAADIGDLRRLCSRYPKVKFLATFLARISQHEAAVLANKFPNLHLYGCWWYCNNPSIIKEITAMRLEILGTGFTVQHSDARVLDQLLYKWRHSRRVIGEVLAQEYQKLATSGWALSRSEVRRDVTRLFGGAYEEFMAK